MRLKEIAEDSVPINLKEIFEKKRRFLWTEINRGTEEWKKSDQQ